MVSGDPWVIQPHEHAKFAEHFRNLNPVNGLVTGEQAKRFMLQSQLPAPILGKIWFLADTNADGKLDLKEFSIACKVINLKLHGVEIPPSLPPSLIGSLSPTGAKQPPVKPPMYGQVPPKPAIPPLPNMPPIQQQPLVQPTQSILSSTQPIQPLIPVSQSGSTGAQSLISTSQPLIPSIPGALPIIPSSQSIMPSTQSVIPSAKPIIPSSQPMIPGTQPIIPGAQPIIPGTQPIIPSAQPIIPSTQPIIPNNQPIIPSTQPIIPSTQPIIPSTQPIITNTQPIISSTPIDWAIIPSTKPLIPSMQPLIPTSQPLIPDSSASSRLGDLTGPPSLPLISGIPPLIPNLSTQPLAAAPPPLIPPQPVPMASQPLGLAGQPLIGSVPPLAGNSGPVMGQSLMNNGSIIPTTQNSLVSSPPSGIGSLISTNGGVGQPVTSTPIAAAMVKPASELDGIKSGISSPPSELPMGMVSSMSQEWGLPQAQRLKYTQLFNVTDRNKAGFISGPQARNIMVQSKLPQANLAQIWALADLDSDGKLGCDEFVLAMYLCEIATQGEPVPLKLPPELIPPTFRRDSVGSAASQSSYEERRRENFARGQAELERRRAALADAQTKEKAERERKEREEAEKKERARLEIQRKEQEELKRKQKEEQEKRDAARKEMERQCQLEWEMKRIRELEAMRADEQSKVLALKARSQRLAGELAEKNTKAGELAREIRETRTGVADLKNTIDGMRSSRDASMQEMSQLKAKVKELNAKQIALNQEKAHLDAKSKTGGADGVGEDGKLNMMEVTLKQLREKVEAAKALVETKRADVDGNKQQLAELTDSVTALSDKCQRVWQLYEEKRQLYNEKKNAAPVESAWDTAPVTSAWSSTAEPGDAWGSAAATENAWGDNGAASVTPTQPEAATETAGPRYRCVYEFVARTVDELSLQPGDLVYEPSGPRAAAEPGWRWGQCRGETGWYPESYVEDIAPGGLSVGAIDPLDSKTPLEGIVEVPENVSEVGTVDTVPAATIPDSVSGAIEQEGETYVAAYSYNSVEPGDLVFDAGEVIQVISRDGDWWTGRIGTRTGIFPSNYVQSAAAVPSAAVSNVAVAAVSESPVVTATEPIADAFAAPAVEETPVYSQPTQETKSSTPVSSEVASITEGAERRAASGTARPGSAARRDSGRDSVTGGPRSGKKQEIAQVLANYTATSAEQLSLQKGQLLIVRKKADSGWWEGELQAKGRNRQQGWFPASYVKVLQASGRTSGRTTPVLSSKIDPLTQDQVIDKVVALYPYTAQNADELSFEKDDIIAVTNRDQDPAWWQGELRGMTGLFPSNYVTKLVHDN